MLNKALKLKLPPFLLLIICFMLMWCLALVTPGLHGFLFIRAAGAACLFLAGLLFCVAGIINFKLAHTTVNPTQPSATSTLVTYGIYSLSRNPMYVGFLGILLGLFFHLGNLFTLVFPALFFFYVNRFQIEPEEQALALLFNNQYADYKKCVRRWL